MYLLALVNFIKKYRDDLIQKSQQVAFESELKYLVNCPLSFGSDSANQKDTTRRNES